MGLLKKVGHAVKKVAKKVTKVVNKIPGGSILAPIAVGALTAGAGLPLAAAAGGATGYLTSNGSIKAGLAGALTGGALAGAGAGVGQGIRTAVGGGFSNLTANAIGTGVLGAAAGGLTGGLKGAALGGVASGVGAYANTGGFSSAPTTSLNSGYNAGDVTQAGLNAGETTLAGAPATKLTAAGGSSLFGGASSYASPLLSAGLGAFTNNKAKDYIVDAQKRNAGLLNPILDQSFDASDLENDPGYQFQLAEGRKAMDAKNAATGGLYSGNAFQEATQFGQGLADQTYGDAYSRFLKKRGQDTGIVGGLTGFNDQIAAAKAGNIQSTGNVLAGSGAALFGGNGISNTGALLGQPAGGVLAGLTPEQLKALLAQAGVAA